MANRERRVGVTMTATMSDGNFVFEGSVENISRTGFKMTDIPSKFNPESSACTAVLSSKTKNYKFSIKPTWSTEKGIYKVVGFEIVSPPAEWIAFLDVLDPEGKMIEEPEEEPDEGREKFPSVLRMTLPGS
ncbi:MAG: hypothetical protein KKD73_01865 [Proteobacteria bacterium]|nr:hypothetical protein [Pseudomonadota bacterium]MBU1640855.1 hypothetical protein [Pseudomonadota bacterium]